MGAPDDLGDLPAAVGDAETLDQPPAEAGGKGKKKGKAARGAQGGKGKAPAAPKTPAAKPRTGRCSCVTHVHDACQCSSGSGVVHAVCRRLYMIRLDFACGLGALQERGCAAAG